MNFVCVCEQTQAQAKPVYTRAKLNFENYLEILLNEKTIKTKATAVKKPTAANAAVKANPVLEKSAPAVAAKKVPSAKVQTVKAASKVIEAPAPIKKAVAKAAPVKKPAATAVETPIAKKVVAKTLIAKKVVAKKVPATKAVATKAVATKAVATKAVAAKVVAKKAVAKKAVAKKAVAKKAASKALSSGKKPSANGLPVRAKAVVNKLLEAVLKALDDMKAKDVVVIDVRNRTSITDDLVFASGTSTRHVKSLADSVAKAARDIKMPPIGVEGEKEAEWVLVDLADVVVHVMLPKTREFYALERMWSTAGDGTGE